MEWNKKRAPKAQLILQKKEEVRNMAIKQRSGSGKKTTDMPPTCKIVMRGADDLPEDRRHFEMSFKTQGLYELFSSLISERGRLVERWQYGEVSPEEFSSIVRSSFSAGIAEVARQIAVKSSFADRNRGKERKLAMREGRRHSLYKTPAVPLFTPFAMGESESMMKALADPGTERIALSREGLEDIVWEFPRQTAPNQVLSEAMMASAGSDHQEALVASA